MVKAARTTDIRLLFGFGALLHPSKISSAAPWAAAFAPGHRLAFQHQVGFATLEPMADEACPHTSTSCAHGAVYAVSESELGELVRRERGYELQSIPVALLSEDLDGERTDFLLSLADTDGMAPASGTSRYMNALAFVSSPWHRLDSPVAPTRRYAELIVRGAEIRGLPEHYISWLREERDKATSGNNVPARYYYTRSRRASIVGSLVAAVAVIGPPVGRRVWQCRAGWTPNTQCESFFVPSRYRE
jgi:hypothetical protein